MKGLVLVVEDNKSILDSTLKILRECGFVADGYSSHWRATNAVYGGLDYVAAIINFPSFEEPRFGSHFAKYSKRLNPSTPIILASGYHLSAKPREVDLVLTKPFSTFLLIPVLEKMWVEPTREREDVLQELIDAEFKKSWAKFGLSAITHFY